MQTSTVRHGNETRWRENGQNGYAWTFATAGLAAGRYFEFDHSPQSAGRPAHLGADWRGWLVTDFYAAYNLIPGHHQRCWVDCRATGTTSNRRRGPILKSCSG